MKTLSKISAKQKTALLVTLMIGSFTTGCIQNPASPESNTGPEIPSLDPNSNGFNEPGPQATPVTTAGKQSNHDDRHQNRKHKDDDSDDKSSPTKKYPHHGFLKINWKATSHCKKDDLESAQIKVASVRIRYANLGWHQVSTDSFRLNLIEAQNQINQLFVRAHVPAGEISEIRFQTEEDGTALLSDGKEAPLFIPSGEQSGLKIKFKKPLLIQAGKLSGVKVHLDFEKSFHVKRISCGKSEVTLKPVIWATYTTEQIPAEIAPTSPEPIDVAQEVDTTPAPALPSEVPASEWTDATPPAPIADGGAYVPVLGI